ncbi:hypothetical protein [Pseudoalteromonas denitrificans]|uniref:DUF2845 domain-containing protein n=1 Tax=Pseudoalteromonas denitrificans DSM 6059 TaxID=1123010 RepID=A0A1I1EU65_9GAMM|nr:hypothetical protein [Pseudoalteromonas denitrificans]SFB90705.1 hypothetical protein SAMN02745724_00448 [Pseudoalteromonas denitrificans DSM 6059]
MSRFISILSLFICLISFYSYANIDSIPLPDDTDIKMKLDGEYPMILNGFVKMPDTDVLAFYHTQLGAPDKIIEDIGRYTFFYRINENKVKISIYQQNQWTEISVMITQ